MWSSGPGSQSWRPIVDLVDGPAKATGFGLGSIVDGDLGGTLRVVKILRFRLRLTLSTGRSWFRVFKPRERGPSIRDELSWDSA